MCISLKNFLWFTLFVTLFISMFYTTKDSLFASRILTYDPERTCTYWLRVAEMSHHCFATAIHTNNIWSKLATITDYCMSTLHHINLPLVNLTNKDDLKGVVLRAINGKDAPCQHVSLGIGGDIEAEKQLKRLWWDCSFTGADPSNNSGLIFQELGDYHQVAVSNQTGISKASVLWNPSRMNVYVDAKVYTLSLVDFFRKANLGRTIDTLFLDAEGAEYVLMPQLQRNGVVEQAGYVICQLSIEIHGPLTMLSTYGLASSADFDVIVSNFLSNSDFIPLWSLRPANHIRMFLVNYRAQECIDRFFFPWCTNAWSNKAQLFR